MTHHNDVEPVIRTMGVISHLHAYERKMYFLNLIVLFLLVIIPFFCFLS